MLPIVCDGLGIRKDDILNLFLTNGNRIGPAPGPVIQQTESKDEECVLVPIRLMENILERMSALEERLAQLESANNASDNNDSMSVADNGTPTDNDEVVSDNEDNDSEGDELSLTKEHSGSENILIRIFRLLFGIEQ